MRNVRYYNKPNSKMLEDVLNFSTLGHTFSYLFWRIFELNFSKTCNFEDFESKFGHFGFRSARQNAPARARSNARGRVIYSRQSYLSQNFGAF